MSTVHVVPLRDAIQHDVPGLDGDLDIPEPWACIRTTQGDDTVCVCGPTAQLVKRDDGRDGWVITHHSLDGREQYETAEG